jgi:hypothetical protein
MSDIFICYSKTDRAIATRLGQRLQDEGWSVFMDVQTNVGKRWHKEIEKELQAARAVVVLWSARSRESDFVLDEAHDAAERGIIFPARIDEVIIPYGFRQFQTPDLIGWDGLGYREEWQRIVAGLHKHLGGEASAAASGAKSPSKTRRSTPTAEESISKRWWRTHPGALTAIAGIIIAITGLVVALKEADESPPLSDGTEIHRSTELPANSRDWFDTGIDVAPGQRLKITASGQINYMGTNPQTNSGPDGTPDIPCDPPACVVQGQPAGRLYGTIENGPPFSIGANTIFKVDNGGRLRLKVNDHRFDDNKGKFTVNVDLQPAQ